MRQYIFVWGKHPCWYTERALQTLVEHNWSFVYIPKTSTVQDKSSFFDQLRVLQPGLLLDQLTFPQIMLLSSKGPQQPFSSKRMDSTDLAQFVQHNESLRKALRDSVRSTLGGVTIPQHIHCPLVCADDTTSERWATVQPLLIAHQKFIFAPMDALAYIEATQVAVAQDLKDLP